MGTKTRFEKEDKRNSEMTYCYRADHEESFAYVI